MTTTDTQPNTRIRRLSERQVTERSALDAVLDEALIAHVAAVTPAGPLVIPMAFARDGDGLLLHCSTGAGLALRSGGPESRLAVSVAILDGLVYAGTLYDSSMNYRSAVVYGVPVVLGEQEKGAALDAIAAKLMPGRSGEVPTSTRRELAATQVLRIPISDFAMKARTGDPSASDGADPSAWIGVLPMTRAWGEPLIAASVDPATVVPESVSVRTARAAGGGA
ncbi:pyridoxamine 5'-phosphate oxidase family protein [Leifsonia flava]|uniref:Pyridoxamine 5'-phosphate oxidase family protein n=1 Tax=Orlajensenia leifsoniae TaxID=2561933 RepID=A0A4Y9R6B7_9MICO|nr:pyridoxamine 5'-phosphate oxidase family protein [Leifsonia flava]TFV99678.1 pyridoxamine 5'-phosphate oxidase family protein [Leifsonia flava]